MTWEEIQEIRKEIASNDSFSQDKSFIFDIVNKYKDVPREKTYDLNDVFTARADKNNWSRRKLDTILHNIVLDIQKLDGYSDDIYDLLTNYLDGLEGNCSWSCITKLSGDPSDQDELTSWVRGNKWWQKDFYPADMST